MSKRNCRQNRPQALNAVRPPQQEPVVMPQTIKLKKVEWLGVVNLIIRDQELQKTEREHLSNKAALAADFKESFTELEASYGLPQGAIGRGEWSIQEGQLICQKPQQQEQVEQRTGTEG